MKKSVSIFSLWLLLVATYPLLAQQNQKQQKLEQEIKALRKQVEELKTQLQILENVEKMDLAKNYSDAQAKLNQAHADLIKIKFDTLKKDLEDANNKWLRGKALLILTLAGGTLGAIVWFWFRRKVDEVIQDKIQERLDDFKEAIETAESTKKEIAGLNKNYVRSILAGSTIRDELAKSLDPQIVFEIFQNDKSEFVRRQAVEVLGAHKYEKAVPEIIEALKSTVPEINDSSAQEKDKSILKRNIIKGLQDIVTRQVFRGLIEYLEYLLQLSKMRSANDNAMVQEWSKRTPPEEWRSVRSVFEKAKRRIRIEAWKEAMLNIADFDTSEELKHEFLEDMIATARDVGMNEGEVIELFKELTKKVDYSKTRKLCVDVLQNWGTSTAKHAVEDLTNNAQGL
jgi:hypothetical protein